MHVAEDNDTLQLIASALDVDLSMLLELNKTVPHITATARLKSGTKLVLPLNSPGEEMRLLSRHIGFASKRPTATLRVVENVNNSLFKAYDLLSKPEQLDPASKEWLGELKQILHKPQQCDSLDGVKELAQHLLHDESLQGQQR